MASLSIALKSTQVYSHFYVLILSAVFHVSLNLTITHQAQNFREVLKYKIS